MKRYIDAILLEARIQSENLKKQQMRMSSVYIGGGTPTCLPYNLLRTMLTGILESFPPDINTEITIESNPGTIDYKNLKYLRDSGVTRLSIGIQSLKDDLLLRLHRTHSVSDSLNAFSIARDVGFTNINVDLIYGIPDQTMKDWQETLDAVLKLAPEHISAYGLMIEEGTPLWSSVNSGLEIPCNEDLQTDMYYFTKDRLEAEGYRHYEISNFALPGYECRHNMVYWQLQPYIGLGAGAHSYINNVRRSNLLDPLIYSDSILNSGGAVQERERFSKADEMSTAVIMQLRTVQGVEEEEFKKRFGIAMYGVFSDAIEKGTARKLLEWNKGRLRLTRYGLMLSNEAMKEFL